MSDSSAASADRNVLLGLLACKLQFVTREQVVAAIRVWLTDKSRPLEDILVEQGALSEERRTLLVALVDNYLKEHEEDATQSLAALSTRDDVPQELRALDDPNIAASLSQIVVSATNDPLRTWSFEPTGKFSSEKDAASASDSRYRILRPLARGGMGQVSVALDEELGREVALKEIHEKRAYYPDSRDRFVREAEITGQLEHPGVVPVYSLGIYADGRPYYAMRFIRGDNLLAHIERFHEHGPDFYAREFRQLLGRFVDVCQAIAYAHARKVLHRDLKPANIVLGNYGETLVVDWGLAKAAGTGEPGRTADGEPFVQLHRSSPSATLDRLGTPAYMSPEQAAGRINELDHTTDIYSLGATLYCLLTGQPPATRGGVDEILQNVEAGNIRPPRTVQPKIPRPLAAICEKAMAHEPAARYSSALDLATEIENWLADNPVTAHHESFLARSARWIRKHPAVTSTVGSSLLLLAVAATVIAGVSAEYNRELGKANEDLVKEKKAVETKNDELRISEQKEKAAATKATTEAARATTEAERANQTLQQSREALLTQQIERAMAIVDHEPSEAVKMLHDTQLCPVALRDISWRIAEHRAQRLIKSEKPAQLLSQVRFSPVSKGYALTTYGGEILIYQDRGDANPCKLSIGKREIWDAAYSPDGKLLAVAVGNLAVNRLREPGVVSIFQTHDGKLVKQIEGFSDRVRTVIFSPDGKQLACGGDDRRVVIHSTKDWSQLYELTQHAASVARIAYFSASQLVSVACEHVGPNAEKASEILIWNFEQPGPATKAELEKPLFRMAALDPNKKVVATVGRDRIVRVWRIPSGSLQVEYLGHTGPVWNLAFSRSGELLATAGEPGENAKRALEYGTGSGGEIRVWRMRDPARPLVLIGHNMWPSSAVFTDGDETLATTSPEGSLKWWRLHDSLPHARLHVGNLGITALARDKEGSRLAVSCDVDAKDDERSGEIVIWDLKQGRIANSWAAHPEMVEALAFSPDGKYLASSSADKTIAIWDSTTAERLHVLKGHEKTVNTVAFSPSGDRLISGSKDLTIRYWDWQKEQELWQRGGHENETSVVVASPDGTTVASGDFGGVIRLWDCANGTLLRELRGHGGILWAAVRDAKFSPDGRWLATCSYDQQVLLWDMQNRALRTRLRGHDGPVFNVDFSSDGQTLVSSGDKLIFWDVANGLQRLAVDISSSGHYNALFAADDSGVIFGDSTGLVHWLHIGARSTQLTFRAHELPPVLAAHYLPNSKAIVTLGHDRNVRVWDAETCQPIHSWIAAEDTLVSALAVSHNSQLVATADMNDQIKVWRLADASVVKQFTGRKKTLLERTVEGAIGGPVDLPGSLKNVYSLAFSPNDQQLAVAANGKVLQIHDPRTGAILHSLTHSNLVTVVAFLTDSQLLAGDRQGNVVIWDLKGKEPRLVPLGGLVSALSVSADGKQIAAGVISSQIKGELWSLTVDGGKPSKVHELDNPVRYISLARNGEWIVASTFDSTVEVCDFPSGRNAVTLRKLTETTLFPGTPVAMSPAGDQLIFGGATAELHRWQRRADGSWKDPLPPQSLFPELHEK